MADDGYNYENTMATLFNVLVNFLSMKRILNYQRVAAFIKILNDELKQDTLSDDVRASIKAFIDKLNIITKNPVDNFTYEHWIERMNEWKNENNDKAENMAEYLYYSMLDSPGSTQDLYTEIDAIISNSSGGKRKSRKMKKSHKRRSRKSRKSRKMKKSHKRKSPRRKSSLRKSRKR